MKRLIFFAVYLSLVFVTNAQDWRSFKFETGDLLFQDLDCGDLCDAIESVTPAVNNHHLSHVGLAYVTGEIVWVIEAMGEDVHLTTIKSFMERQTDALGQPKVIVGRVSDEYSNLAGRAVGFALEQKGKPYDDEFIYDNGKYYCSELIYDAFKAAHNNKPIFEMMPMTFKDPKTNKTLPVWEEYFKNLGRKIPEEKKGISPGLLANDDNVEIVKYFY